MRVIKRFTAAVRPPKTWPLIVRFWPYVRTHRRTLAALAGIALLSLSTGIIPPLLIKYLIDTVVQGGRTDLLLPISLGLLLMAVLAQGLTYTQTLLVRRLHLMVMHRMGRRVYEHLLQLPMSYYAQHDTGYVMSRVRDDLATLGASMINYFLLTVTGAVRATIFTALIFYLDPVLSATGLAVLAVVMAINVLFSKALRQRSKAAQEAYARASSALHEGITGMSLIKATVRERFEVRRYVRMMGEYVRLSYRRHFLGVLSGRTLDLMAELSIYAVVVLGAYRLMTGATTFGNLFAFSLYIIHLYGAMSSLLQQNPELQNTMNSLERVYEVLDLPAEPRQNGHRAPVPSRCEIVFEGVNFGYAEEQTVLHDVSVKIPAGAQVALVGPSGAGKSTFASLIPRFYDPTAGRILLNGHDLRDIKPYDVRRLVGMVPQDVFLFDRTVAENIAYGNHRADPEVVERAARAANAHQFISELPDGYATRIGERGVRLSVGQKQRIAIAREVMRDPPILILDEATSSLDSVSESLIQEALQRLKQNRTWIVIAHRLSTVIESDWILVFHRGRIVEQGTHEQLLAKGGFYTVLFETQFKRGLVVAE